jgi:hypothetical protein
VSTPGGAGCFVPDWESPTGSRQGNRQETGELRTDGISAKSSFALHLRSRTRASRTTPHNVSYRSGARLRRPSQLSVRSITTPRKRKNPLKLRGKYRSRFDWSTAKYYFSYEFNVANFSQHGRHRVSCSVPVARRLPNTWPMPPLRALLARTLLAPSSRVSRLAVM